MNGVDSAGAGDAEQFGDQETIMNPKPIAIVVGDIPIVIAEPIQALERRRVNAKMNTLVRNRADQFDGIAFIYGVAIVHDLVDAIYGHYAALP
jgi:hypothetical protein